MFQFIKDLFQSKEKRRMNKILNIAKGMPVSKSSWDRDVFSAKHKMICSMEKYRQQINKESKQR